MDKKTNKTDHVLNLLSGNKKKEKEKGKTPANIVKESNAKEKKAEEVASLIQEQLELELEKEERENARMVAPQKVMEPEELPMEQVEEEPEELPVEQVEEKLEEPEYTFVNVMEHVVSKKAKVYMEKFGNCMCPRCIADVKAYALTHLPSKYVVVQSSGVFPLLNFYADKYSGQVLVELTKACIVVKENPHHKVG